MNTYLCTNIPVQMISCTDTDGKITPLRFRFKDKDDSVVIVNIKKIINSDRETNKMGVTFECSADSFGTEKHFFLYYSIYSGKWAISKIGQ